MKKVHHEIFSKFPCWSGNLDSEYAWATFVGAKVHHSFAKEYVKGESDRFVNSSYPNVDEEYFEWIDLLDAIENADDMFTMVELGAGYGRWIVNAAKALEIASIRKPYVMIGVEAEETHFKWMCQHIVNNGLDLTHFRLIKAAIGNKDGFGLFPMGIPEESYGQSLVNPKKGVSFKNLFFNRITRLLGKKNNQLNNKNEFKTVRVHTLEQILNDLTIVDIIDMDIQGTEFEVLDAAQEILNQKVKCIHIGTHSSEVETALRKLFHSLKWQPVWDFSLNTTQITQWGYVEFSDGVQTWKNPAVNKQISVPKVNINSNHKLNE